MRLNSPSPSGSISDWATPGSGGNRNGWWPIAPPVPFRSPPAEDVIDGARRDRVPRHAAETRGASSCANVMPHSALIARTPRLPSEAFPESTMPMARLPCYRRQRRKKMSIGR